MDKNNLDTLDMLNVLSFVIGLMNYNENLTQGDKQDLMKALDKQTQVLLEQIHNDIQRLEAKIDEKNTNARREDR